MGFWFGMGILDMQIWPQPSRDTIQYIPYYVETVIVRIERVEVVDTMRNFKGLLRGGFVLCKYKAECCLFDICVQISRCMLYTESMWSLTILTRMLLYFKDSTSLPVLAAWSMQPSRIAKYRVRRRRIVT